MLLEVGSGLIDSKYLRARIGFRAEERKAAIEECAMAIIDEMGVIREREGDATQLHDLERFIRALKTKKPGSP
jgi:hypothetical protein